MLNSIFMQKRVHALHVTENSQCFVRDDVRKFGKIGGTKYFHQRYTLVTLAQVRKINLNTVHLLVIWCQVNDTWQVCLQYRERAQSYGRKLELNILYARTMVSPRLSHWPSLWVKFNNISVVVQRQVRQDTADFRFLRGSIMLKWKS